MRSRTGLPNTHIAGDSLVAGSGVLRCWRTARWNASVFRLPLADMLPARSLLIDLTPISARQLLCGKATELRRWCMPQSLRNWTVMAAVNSGPPSVASSSGPSPPAAPLQMPSISPEVSKGSRTSASESGMWQTTSPACGLLDNYCQLLWGITVALMMN